MTTKEDKFEDSLVVEAGVVATYMAHFWVSSSIAGKTNDIVVAVIDIA